MVLAASMLGSPPASTQRCCLTTEVSLSRTQGDPRAKNLEISRCRRRVPASGVTPGGIRECTSSGSGQATWQCPARPPCAATARHSRRSSHFPCVKLCSIAGFVSPPYTRFRAGRLWTLSRPSSDSSPRRRCWGVVARDESCWLTEVTVCWGSASF